MNSSMSGWSALRMTILAARRVLPPALDRAGRRVGAAHEAHRPAGVPPPFRCSYDERMLERLIPEPEPPLKIVPSSRYQLRMPSIVSSTARMKHATRLPGYALHADVEPHRRVERGALGDEEVLQLVAEGGALLLVDEVAVLHAPRRDRVGDAVDHLAQRGLALLGAEGAAEVLLGDDVGGVLRPGDRELDVGLQEGVGAVLPVRDPRLAAFPLERVVRVDARFGEVPTDTDPDLLRRQCHACLSFLGALDGREIPQHIVVRKDSRPYMGWDDKGRTTAM